MKLFFRIILMAFGAYILIELNSNSLLSDVKSFFHKNSNRFSFDDYTSSDTGKISSTVVQILHLKDDSCKKTDTSQIYLYNASFNRLIGPAYGFVYKKQYYLHICKLTDSFSQPLNNVIKQNDISAKHCYGYIESDNESAVDYSHKITANQNITSIYLKLLGKNNRLVLKNDSVACYYSLFTTFSIQYNNLNARGEIYAETKGSGLFHTDLLPIEILFLKRDHKLYLLTMSAYNDVQDIKYSPGMLYNLIKPIHANNN